MKKPGERAEDDEDEPEERRGDPPGAGPLLLLQQLAEDRDERGAESGMSAASARTRFGIWNATVKALISPSTPK